MIMETVKVLNIDILKKTQQKRNHLLLQKKKKKISITFAVD